MVDPTHGTEDGRRTPVVALAVAGGSALLLGMAFLAWHALQQGWVHAKHELIIEGIVAAALVAAAWPLARRGHAAVAGAVGGAGLGAWFSAWVVARYVHEIVSAPQAFGALAVGAGVGLLIADRLRLRLMGGLAVAAACATPAITASGADRLAELMVYQFVVIGVVLVLDGRRRWPELPTIAVLATWALLSGWAAQHLQSTNTEAFVGAAALLLIVAAVSAWRTVLRAAEVAQAERTHARVRIAAAGAAAWGAIGWAFAADPGTLAVATAALAAWHGALAAVLLLRGGDPSQRRLVTRMAWTQAAAVPALALHGAAASAWWAAMAAAAAGLTWAGSRRSGPRLLVLPTLCAAAWALGHPDAAWSLPAVGVAAVIPLAVGLWSNRSGEARPLLVALGTVVWVAGVAVVGPESIDVCFMIALIPVVAVGVRALADAPEPGGPVGAWLAPVAMLLVLVAVAALSVVVAVPLAAPGLMTAVLLGLALLGAGVVARSAGALARESDLVGMAVAGLAGVASVVAVPLAVSTYVGPAHTVALAGLGLGLVIAGLRLYRSTWRHAGLAVLVAAGAKVVVLDMAGSGPVARALSFIGIGAVLILGALAYSRAHRRARAAARDPENDATPIER